MYCRNCGVELKDGTAFCTNCGQKQDADINNVTDNKNGYNTMCVVGFVMSLISLLINFWGIVGIIGTVLSIVGLMNCKKKNEKGKGLAIAGIIIGVISIFYGFYSILVLASIFS